MTFPERQAAVMIVDDVPENLTLLKMILLKENYQVSIFTNGPEALEAAQQNPPDIFLLDISMPGMDGYEVCQIIKADEKLSRIPVIFVSALNQIQEKIKGFEVGAQDYVTKPYQIKEIKARVRTHLELAWTRRELEETLDHTLTGSIKLVTDFLGFVNPTAFSRAFRIKQNMMAMVEYLQLEPKRWFELAALLSQLGFAALPSYLQEKFALRKKLNPGEADQVHHSIELIAVMVRSIPRLESVADMIALHTLTIKLIGDKEFDKLEAVEKGGMILNLLQQYDQMSMGGELKEEIIETLRNEGNFPEILYEALQFIHNAADDWETHYCRIGQLVSGMILEEDIQDSEGRTLLKKGVKLSDTIIQAIRFHQNRLAKDRFTVKIIPMLD